MNALRPLLFVLLMAATCSASGYTYRDGYYWRDGQAYARYRAKVCYGSYCRYEWRYKPVAAQKRSRIDYQDEGWRARLLELAKNKDAWLQSAKRSALEHNEFLEAVKALNLEAEVGYSPRYAEAGGYAYAQQSGYQPIAQQGDTVYGYSLNRTLEQYGSADNSVLFDQAERLTEQAQELGGDAHERFMASLQLESSARERVARVYAEAEKVRAAGELLRASVSPWSKYSETITGDAATDGGGGVQFARGGSLIDTKCVSCHGGENPKAGMSLQDIASLDAETRELAVVKVMRGEMPLDKEGEPNPLSEAEKLAFVAEWALRVGGQE